MRKGILALLAIGLFCGTMSPARPSFTGNLPPVGQPAPDFELLTFDGRKIHLADLKGRVVLLNFWATWCTPCKAELPLLDTYFRIAREKGAELEFFAVATEDSLTPYQLKPVQEKVSFPMIKAFHGGYGAMKAVPTNFIIDRDGILRYGRSGALSLDVMNATLLPLINAGKAGTPSAGP